MTVDGHGLILNDSNECTAHDYTTTISIHKQCIDKYHSISTHTPRTNTQITRTKGSDMSYNGKPAEVFWQPGDPRPHAVSHSA